MTALQQYQQRVYNTCIAAGLKPLHATIITSQATHESGNFKSALFKRANNVFGLTIPHKRKSQYISGNAGKQPDGDAYYAAYKSLEDSVKDLVLSWHVYNKTNWAKITSAETYAAYLKSKGYYGDTLANYTRAILSRIPGLSFLSEGIATVVTSPVTIIPILALTVLLIFIFKK